MYMIHELNKTLLFVNVYGLWSSIFLPNMNFINQQLPLDRIKSTFEINFFALDVPENP